MVFLEWIGAATGLLGVWLTLHRNLWCFPIGLVNVTISAYLFFDALLYADAIQQVVFGCLIVYGWFTWSRVLKGEELPIGLLGTKGRWLWVSVAVAVGGLLGFLLDQYTPAHFPYVDSMLTAFCFLAQYLIATRKLENWTIWMVTNAGYVVLYIYKDLHVYAGLYAIYFLLAIWGYRQWKSLM
ncbi:MAG: nicotinamide riboside transporter PnuC [Bacteroidia bacterium]